ncbi:hypothetical protein GKF79_24965, partial [Escherichia coli]|nr:hypothetical protein [Escherichia coli]
MLDGVLTPSSPPPGAHHFPRDKNDRPTRLLPQGRATVISTTKVPIGRDSGNFAHLCGLDYYLDDSKRCRLPPRKLYEDLLRGRRISPKRVSPHGDVQWLKKKADVLTDAMDMSKVTHVVVSGNSRIVLYAGNEVWCIGLGRMR